MKPRKTDSFIFNGNVVKCIRSSQKGRIHMKARKPMPKEYVIKLKEHPYVAKATEWTVSFTPEFKRIAYESYYAGKSMRDIFKDSGFDVEILGEKRLQNFRNKLLEKAEMDAGFKDERKNNCRREAQSTEAQMAKRIRELEHRNAYLEQENEFLKKIQSVEKGCSGKAGGAK